ALTAADLAWRIQAEQLVTGHAVAEVLAGVPDDHHVLVLCGDVPLVQPGTVAPLLEIARPGALALLTVDVDDPTGYGRVLRDARGAVTRIVEAPDATDEERRVRAVSAGLRAPDAGDSR